VLSLALFVTATVLFSPWMLNYDMVVFGWLLALLRQRPDNTALDDGLAIAVWTLPGAMLLLGSFDIPIAMLVMPAFAGRLLWRLAHETTQRAVDDGARGGVEEAAEMTPVSIAGLAAQ
jgi:alpha-1,2-mannosyltransferase